MKKMRLPKPVATHVINQHCYYGSVYTAEQMRKFAEKAVLLEREACAKVCETEWSNVAERMYGEECAAAIRARGNT